jgi:multidrug transporter EmrE-like cation transporter
MALQTTGSQIAFPDGYIYLAIAIVAEVIATSALKASEHLSRPVPSVIVVTGYVCSFYCLARVLNTIPRPAKVRPGV